MAYLFDTNCFIRVADKNSPMRPVVLNVFKQLRSQNRDFYITPQVISEFWNVCTRPATARGGLGFTPQRTAQKVELIRKHFTLLPDSLVTFDEWLRLVTQYSVSGTTVHDTKFVASMIVHGVKELITFNTADFERYKMIRAIDPRDL